MDLLTSEEEPDEEEYNTNSEEGYPYIQRVLTYPARLTDDGGVERIGPVEVLSEADPNWNQWDQDQCFAHRGAFQQLLWCVVAQLSEQSAFTSAPPCSHKRKMRAWQAYHSLQVVPK